MKGGWTDGETYGLTTLPGHIQNQWLLVKSFLLKLAFFSALGFFFASRNILQKTYKINLYTIGNKAGYTAIQSRTVGQEQYHENCSEFKNVTDRRT